eukprot:7416582-Pyramimonas_sp.AAC.1
MLLDQVVRCSCDSLDVRGLQGERAGVLGAAICGQLTQKVVALRQEGKAGVVQVAWDRVARAEEAGEALEITQRVAAGSPRIVRGAIGARRRRRSTRQEGFQLVLGGG